MAKITETFLPKFVTQLNQFNNTEAPIKYNKVKENYVKSFANEIKSYEFFHDFLKTNNSTANKLSWIIYLLHSHMKQLHVKITSKQIIAVQPHLQTRIIILINKHYNSILVTTNDKIERQVSIL